ncbi:MAG: hypothetical protein GWP91_18450 [Rhodobacterales bacterium]|nr:hypothetical protein [Rhodobacterales bacterium]
MNWKHLPIVAFDVETTGLEPFNGDRVIEVGLVQMYLDDDGTVAERIDHSFLINPGIPIPHAVVKLTGISDSDVADKPPFDEVAEKIYEVLSGAITVAHNYTFDLAFLSQEFKREDMRWPEPMAEVDTLALSRICFPDARSHRLGEVCSRMGIPLENAHRATDDAAACGHVFINLARKYQVEDNLQAMLNWSNAIGRPPDNSPFGPNEDGVLAFLDGPYIGEPIASHPLHLAWFDKARVRRDGDWHWRYPESVRDWTRRWLEVRGSGGGRGTSKTFHKSDWVLDPCIASPRRMTS